MNHAIRSLLKYYEIRSQRAEDLWPTRTGDKWKSRRLYKINADYNQVQCTPRPAIHRVPALETLYPAYHTVYKFRDSHIRTATSAGWFQTNYHRVLAREVSEDYFLIALAGGILDSQTSTKVLADVEGYLTAQGQPQGREQHPALCPG